MWNGFGYLPRHKGSSTWAIFFQLRGSGSLESNTEQLFSRRLFIMHRKRPSGEKPTSWPGEKILSNLTSQWSLSIRVTGYWSGASLLNWRKATGSKSFSASRITWPPHNRTTVDAQRPLG